MPDAHPDAHRVTRLPRLWAGRRRRDLTLLVLTGLGQAVVAGVAAVLLSSALHGVGGLGRSWAFVALLAAAVLLGLLRMAERVIAEQLSQHYVHQLRLGLLRRTLVHGEMRSLGVAVTRSTNDLTSVKNWVGLGVAPLAVGIPLLVGAGGALFWLEPWFLVALLAPLAMLGLAVALLTPVAYRRSRELRQRRGRLSSQVADSVLATPAIRSAGGSDREMRRIARRSHRLVGAAISRAWAAGGLRGAAAMTGGTAMALVVGITLLAGLPTHSAAGALAIVGFLANPINDLGRVAEYRQSYRAARRILAPAIASSETTSRSRRRQFIPASGGDVPPDGVVLPAMALSDGRELPQTHLTGGARVVADTGDPAIDSEVLARLVGPTDGNDEADVVVEGRRLSTVGPNERRTLVGYAAQGMLLTRGSVLRTVRYRYPEASLEEVQDQLCAVGLASRVAGLPDGVETRLVHGGEPLTTAERGRLLLARATFQHPPLLVLDNLDADLGRDGRDLLRALLKDYPGVVLVASDDPEQIVDATAIWQPCDGAAASGQLAAQPTSR